MPQPIQLGETADRLRRFFNLTGRIPAQLDETVVPIANLGDLFQPPFRTATRAFVLQDERPAAAGFPSQIAITLPAGTAGTTPPGAMVVTHALIDNSNAGAVNYSLRVAYNLTTAWSAIGNAIDLDRLTNEQGTLQRLPPVLRASNAVAVIGTQFLLMTLAASEARRIELPQPIVLGPGAELISASANNAINRSSFWGIYHPTAELY